MACSFLLGGACLVSCSSRGDEPEVVNESQSRTITFSAFDVTSGSMSDSFTTRAALANEPAYMLVLDVMNGAVQSTLTRSADQGDDVLGNLSLNLAYGTHDLYFVCSANPWASVDEANLAVTWAASTAVLGDTWGKHLQLEVSASTSASQSITLDRLVAYIRLKITDAIPSGVTTFQTLLAGGSWTLSLPTLSGSVASAVGNTITVPSSKIGETDVTVGLFTFVPEGTTTATSYTFQAFDASGATVATATFSDVPLAVNRYTVYSGKLFSGGVGLSFSTNTDWDTPYEINF